MLFLLWDNESRYGQLFEDLRKEAFVGRYRYPETSNRAYELLMSNSSQFDGNIPREGRKMFRSERIRGGRTRIMFIQARITGDKGGHSSTPVSNLLQVDSFPRVRFTVIQEHGVIFMPLL